MEKTQQFWRNYIIFLIVCLRSVGFFYTSHKIIPTLGFSSISSKGKEEKKTDKTTIREIEKKVPSLRFKTSYYMFAFILCLRREEKFLY